jgi:hypothetical protein
MGCHLHQSREASLLSSNSRAHHRLC